MKTIKTLKVRVKDKHAPVLARMAKSVNLVWNYLNDLSNRSIKERGVFLSGYDLQKYTNGCAKELGLHAHTVQRVASEYSDRRRQFNKSKLRWRKSVGSRRSLGWVPLNIGSFRWKSGQVFYSGHYFNVWDSYGLEGVKFRSGSFNEDARGRWYFNVMVEFEAASSSGGEAIGIDLGLKDVATCSDGARLQNNTLYRVSERRLATAQRASKKARTRAIHAKIRNQRKDALHKFSNELAGRCRMIVVGNIRPLDLAKTTMAKSVLDAGWGLLRTMLEYKCANAGVVFKVVSERNTTQTCSCCGALPDSRPRGIAGLGIREWTCSECGVTHDRDVNAAKNILALGHERPAGGIAA